MATMTLNMNDDEMAALEALASEFDMSKTAVIKQAFRLYQLVVKRQEAGETFHFSGDKDRAIQFIGPGFHA